RCWQAVRDLHRAAVDGKLAPGLARTLGLKALIHSIEAHELEQLFARSDATHRSPSDKLKVALVIHNFYLTSSAFLGRDDEALFDLAVRAYQSLLAERTDA